MVTADHLKSYKAAHAHCRRLLEKHASRDRVIHVGQSLVHDGVQDGECYTVTDRRLRNRSVPAVSSSSVITISGHSDAVGIGFPIAWNS